MKKHIIEYNQKAIEKSLADDTYRGEEGNLRIRPEIANSLGMKAFIDQDYLDSISLFKDADRSLEKAKSAMASRRKERFPEYYAQKIMDHFLIFKRDSEAARDKLMRYRSRLISKDDERFNKSVCERLMDEILEEGLNTTDNRLRDGLGYFYNITQGLNQKGFQLTPDNVRFVNYVFNAFLKQASKEDVKEFDLDRDSGYRAAQSSYNWKDVAGPEISKYSSFLEEALKKSRDEIYEIDPLLFISLIRKESDFNPLSVSYVGAAGLTQIMPQTAKDMGMKKIHMPAYFNDAVSYMQKERKLRKQAMATLFNIKEKSDLQYAEKARELMQTSLDFGRQRERLFKRYRRELFGNRDDERLQPEKAIEYGLRYFARLMKDQKGDISLALASYNAGPHRIRNYDGIPPFAETVGFRNRVLHYYRDYLRRATGK